MTDSSMPPSWLSLAGDCQRIDVRPMLANGDDPLMVLLSASSEIPDGGMMVVEAPINPWPLRSLLAGQGFSSYGQCLGPSHWRVTFHRDGGHGGNRDEE